MRIDFYLQADTRQYINVRTAEKGAERERRKEFVSMFFQLIVLRSAVAFGNETACEHEERETRLRENEKIVSH